MVKFCFEKVVKGKPYPNLATHKATPYTESWRKFSVTSPFSEPPNFLEYMNHHKLDYEIVDLDEADNETYYFVAISFFDFSIDWFSLMNDLLISKLKANDIKVLFYYWEADNPYRIDEHLSKQCEQHNIPREQILFVSGNSEALKIPYFFYVVEDELLYQFRNKDVDAVEYHERDRDKKYTALVRMHKYWRANIMSTLWQQRLDTQGYFAYGDQINADETEDDNPIEVDNFFGLRQRTRSFLNTLPFKADDFDSDEQNDHTILYKPHFENSYLNVVIESHMDVDQSGGILITEKTFKPIKHAQMFIIFGTKGSLQQLRDLGYRVFDDVLDNSYDEIENTTERYDATMKMLTNLLENSNQSLKKLYIKCKDDIIHNQKLFLSSKANRIEKLIEDIKND